MARCLAERRALKTIRPVCRLVPRTWPGPTIRCTRAIGDENRSHGFGTQLVAHEHEATPRGECDRPYQLPK